MGNPVNGQERRASFLGILGGDLRQWWESLGMWAKIGRLAVSLVVVAFLAGGWWFSVQAAYGPLPDQMEGAYDSIQSHTLQLQRLDRTTGQIERDVTRMDLRQDSIVRVLGRIEGTVRDTRCWARVSADVADPSECIQGIR